MGPAVVFDTNILISATFSTQGNPFRCIALAREGAASSITCNEILAEYMEKLVHKFDIAPSLAESAVQEIRAMSTIVNIDHDLKVIA
jgi:putative PIN family toxin of toxin-antitoxin system